ncbi:MAG TPA: SDR family NAD(P)-dependent oxidoreductase, partial [Chthoniobacterales bacterium]
MSGFDFTGCSALITGASAGIGREFARQLAGRAGSLVVVARRLERLEELRHELTKKDPNLNVHCRAVDLSRQNEVEELCAWLLADGIAIDFLINNAGLGDRGSFATAE